MGWILPVPIGRMALVAAAVATSFLIQIANETRAAPAFPWRIAQSTTADQDPDHDRSVELAAAQDQLWAAARQGDAATVARLLDGGVNVDVATAYGSTALCFASDRGHVEVVRLLLERGANPNTRDTFYKATPLSWAQSNAHFEVIRLLLAHGAEGADDLLLQAIGQGNCELAQAAINSQKISNQTLAIAQKQSVSMKRDDLVALFADLVFPALELADLTAEEMRRYAGTFEMEGGAVRTTIAVENGALTVTSGSASETALIQIDKHEFVAGSMRLRYEIVDGTASALTLKVGGNQWTLRPAATAEHSPTAEPSTAIGSAEESGMTDEGDPPADWSYQPSPDDLSVSSINWPGFRGTAGRGIADGQSPPKQWDGETGQNLLWKTAIPGLANSCPVIWGDRLFVTTAACESANRDVRIGHYGDVDSIDDDSVYDFTVYCLDKETGSVRWSQTVHTGKPAVKRHSKSSHANPTSATDGRYLVSSFGTEGLYCHDLDGRLLWKRDLGFLDSGWFLDPGYQWGFGSSPIIFEGLVIVQCDIQKDSFVAAFELQSGKELWRTPRDEVPSWSTPVVHRFGDVPMLITHGTHAARGYDVRDGTLLWSVTGHSEIVVPTPFVAHGLIFLASGYAPVQPIVALKPSARGEIALVSPEAAADGASASPHLAWNTHRGGPYMPTPIVYGDLLYVCSNTGILTCYRAVTGEQVYKERIKIGGTATFTASPIAADGYLYFTAEDGRVAVVRAGERYALAGVNPCGQNALATPAISAGTFFVRTLDQVMAFRETERPLPVDDQ